MTPNNQATALVDPQGPPGPKTRGIALDSELYRQTRFQETVHEHHWDARAKIINALGDPDHAQHHAAARRMSNCAQGASFFIDPSNGIVRPWLSRCGHRLCPFCSNARSATASESLTELMIEHHADRMIILTIRSHDLPLADQITSLLAAFKRLRHRATWKAHVNGGVYILEVTLNEETKLWHPHLHILYRGSYYPQAEISKQWREITDGSNIVWVTKVSDTTNAARELAKYIGKPQRIKTFSAPMIREYATAVKAVRMVQTFGNLYRKKPRDEDPVDQAPRTDERVRLSTLLHIARSGHPEAIVLLTLLCQRYTVFGRYVHHECPQLVPDPRPVDRTLQLLAILRGDPRPADQTQESELDPARLTAKICAAYMAYKAGIAEGRFGNVKWYHQTETERIDGDFPGRK